MFRFESQRELLGEMIRVCRPDGLLVCEFDSIHKGLFISRYLEQRRVARRTKFNNIREIRTLFPKERFASVRVIGTALPKAFRLLKFIPAWGERIESVAHHPPLNWLAERVIVAARLLPDISPESAREQT